MELQVDFWQSIKAVLEPLRILVELIVFSIGAIWGSIKYREYRELKQFIQFDIEARIFRLPKPVVGNSVTYNRDESGIIKKMIFPDQEHTFGVEVYLNFENKGKTRFRLYNAEVALNTMRGTSDQKSAGEVKFDEHTGRVVLRRLRTSGNIIPKESRFYYIEPGVAQVITYLIFIPEPDTLLQVVGKFSMEQQRIFPYKSIGSLAMVPHTASRTYFID